MLAVGEKQYLGDGVYVSHDGYQLWLHVDNRPSVALDYETYLALRTFGDVYFQLTEQK